MLLTHGPHSLARLVSMGLTCGWLPGNAPHESFGMAKPAMVQQFTCTAPYLRPAMVASNACLCSACTQLSQAQLAHATL